MWYSRSARFADAARVLGILVVVALLLTGGGVARGEQAMISEPVLADIEVFIGADGPEDGDVTSLVVPRSGEVIETADGFTLP